MRLRVVHNPTIASIDGIRLDVFEVGHEYEVGNLLGAVMLAEGWAEPVLSAIETGAGRNVNVRADASLHPQNLIRQTYQPNSDRPSVTPDRTRMRRRKKRVDSTS